MNKSRPHRPQRPAVALIVLLLAANVSAKTVPLVQSVKPSSPVRIDGQADEWTAASRVVDAKTGLALAFQNDDRNLYVLVVITKPEVRESLKSTGLTLLGRPRGSKTSRGAIFMTRPVAAEAFFLWQESRGVALSEKERADIRAEGKAGLTLAFSVDPAGNVYGPLVRRGAFDPPDLAVSENQAAATYELRIPLSGPEPVPGGIGVKAGGSVRIALEWGGQAQKIGRGKSTREIPPSEKGEVSPSGQTWAQELLNSFEVMSRPELTAKKYHFTIDVNLAGAI